MKLQARRANTSSSILRVWNRPRPWLPALRDVDTKSGPAASWVVVGTGYVLRAPRAAVLRTGRDREVLNAVLPWSMAHNHMLRVFAQVEMCRIHIYPKLRSPALSRQCPKPSTTNERTLYTTTCKPRLNSNYLDLAVLSRERRHQ